MKNSNRLPLIVAAAAIAVVGVGTVLVKRAADTPEPVESAAPVAAAPASPAPSAAGAGARRGPATVEPTDLAVERRGELRDQHIARTAKLKKDAMARFEAESVDPAWAPQKESDLKDIAAAPGFETAGVAPRNLDIECKSSMCRLDGTFESNGEAEDWLLIYMSSVGGKLPNAIVSRSRNPDGSARVEIHGRAR